MGFWFWLFWFIATTLVNKLLQPRLAADEPRPSSLGEFSLPTAEEGRVIPVLWGTCNVRGPNVTWYGSLNALAIERDDVVIGYQYYLYVQYCLCQGPIEDVLEVRFDDSPAAMSAVDFGTYKRLTINAPYHFGGGPPRGDGGVGGVIDLYLGGSSQTADPSLEDLTGDSLPGYRGVCYAVAKNFWFGNSAYLKPISFVLRRLPNQLGIPSGQHNVNGDANPAAVLYEILTDVAWGLGISAGQIDAASFLAAAATLYSEDLGISMLVDAPMSGAEMIAEVLRHVDGLIYADPATGLLTLKLARADYSIPSLLLLDQDSVSECKFVRRGWLDTHNEVRVRYVDRSAAWSERVAQAQDLANISARSGEISAIEHDFRGLSSAARAQKAAARFLMSAAYPLAGVEIVANRKAWSLRPGSVFRLSWAPLGISEMVCRVTRLQGGELLDGRIRIDAVEDIFAVSWTGYTAPAATRWLPPVTTPQPLAAARLVEWPYALLGSHGRNVMTLGVRGAGVTLGYQVWSDTAGGANYVQTNDVLSTTPSGRLTAVLGEKPTTFTVEVPVDLDGLQSITAVEFALGRHQVLIDEEWIAWQTIVDNGDGTFTLSGAVRGVMDSTPKPHAVGTRIYFITEGAGLTRPGAPAGSDYPADLTLTAKLLPQNSLGVLAIGSASQLSVTTQSRAERPYVPTAIELNDVSYPVHIADALDVSWLHRNRLAYWEYDDAGQTASPESGSTYRIKVYGEGGALIHTETGLTGTSWGYPKATEISESGLGRLNGQLRVVLESLNASALVSQQAYDFTVHRAGWGMRYGQYWGGTAG